MVAPLGRPYASIVPYGSTAGEPIRGLKVFFYLKFALQIFSTLIMRMI